MSVHGFVKIVEFWLLKLQHESKNKQNEQEVGKVSEMLFQQFDMIFSYLELSPVLGMTSAIPVQCSTS